MIYLDKPVIVEGKYDKIKLSAVISSPIITTEGFGIFNNREKAALIKKLAASGGVIVITDSDGAGLVIRNKIKNIASGCNVENIYIPQICGKERRKDHPSKEGYLGVEGMEVGLLEKLLEKYIAKEAQNTQKVTKTDMYFMGLCGGKNSSLIRSKVCTELELPHDMSANALCEAVNMLYSLDILEKTVKKVLTMIDTGEKM